MPPKGATAAPGAPEAKVPKTVKRYVAKCDYAAGSEAKADYLPTHQDGDNVAVCVWNFRLDPVLHDTPGKAWKEAFVHAREAGHLKVEEHEYTVERKVSVKLTPIS